MGKVAILKCDEYEYEKVQDTLLNAISLLGGIDKFIFPGAKVVVKPNLLRKAAPRQNITTHPFIVRAICTLAKEAGGDVTIAESPGGIYTKAALKAIYDATGMTEAAEKSGAKLNYDTDVVEVEFGHGSHIESLRLIKPVVNADVIISAAKLKTHSMMGYTGAVKNMYGAVPGVTKAEYHFRMKDKDRFADMLIDLYEFIHPSLSIIDAIWGMEGEGPAAGDPVKIGALMASDDAVSLDLAATHMVGMDAGYVPVLKRAIKRSICLSDISNIEFLGDAIDNFKCKIKTPVSLQQELIKGYVPGFLEGFADRCLALYPAFDKDKCISCMICKDNCPAGAIRVVNSKPKLSKKSCIQCYCCHELCPKKAIKIKRPWIFSTAEKLFK
ncbi:MAG: DUF362 domain-containing protein [Eubacteriales bacterium]